MLPEERYQKILTLLQSNGMVRIEELKNIFTVTSETIRRDLMFLEKSKQLKRVHGGAIPTIRGMKDASFRARFMENMEQKQTIAKLAARFIKENEIIMLDASTSSFFITNYIKHFQNVVVISHSLKVCDELSKSKIKIIGLGGELDSEVYAFIGVQTVKALHDYYATHSFISCYGIDKNLGIMDISLEEVAIKEKMISHASKSYLLMDSTKLRKKGVVRINGLDHIDYVITDKKPSHEWVEYFEQYHITLLYPDAPPSQDDEHRTLSISHSENTQHAEGAPVHDVDLTHTITRMLSDTDATQRARGIDYLAAQIEIGTIQPSHAPTRYTNNHVHSIYSFSPYNPSLIAFKAWDAGLSVCGIVDHESVAGSEEMKRACARLHIGCTVGYEVRVNFYNTPFEKMKINNPDMEGIAYTVIHGVALNTLSDVDRFLQPLRKARLERSARQVGMLNEILSRNTLPTLSFEKDVVAVSQYEHGGTVTERHILYACAEKLVAHSGKGTALIRMLSDVFSISAPKHIQEYLMDETNPHYIYDVLGLLKQTLLSEVYIPPGVQECLPVQQVVDFARSTHAIPAYPYLGDVSYSVTGDKRAEKFEDDYLPQLFSYIARIGYLACTYMPPRNTAEQLHCVRELCAQHNLLEISGVDINSPRQEFLYHIPDTYAHLIESAWALVAHEDRVETHPSQGLFGNYASDSELPILQRVQEFSHYAQHNISTKGSHAR